jgi:hypothetical protein
VATDSRSLSKKRDDRRGTSSNEPTPHRLKADSRTAFGSPAISLSMTPPPTPPGAPPARYREGAPQSCRYTSTRLRGGQKKGRQGRYREGGIGIVGHGSSPIVRDPLLAHTSTHANRTNTVNAAAAARHTRSERRAKSRPSSLRPTRPRNATEERDRGTRPRNATRTLLPPGQNPPSRGKRARVEEGQKDPWLFIISDLAEGQGRGQLPSAVAAESR